MLKIKLDRPVIVEGKYDKIKLSSIIDANIIDTDGFGIFKENEKKSLIRRVAEKNGVIVLTDSDGAGLVIRNYINSILPKDKISHLYIPEIKGKERRKKTVSKEGLLGVEGINADMLRQIFSPFVLGSSDEKSERKAVTKYDMYEDGLFGNEMSAKKRKDLLLKLGLPSNLSSNALLEAINMLYTYEEYKDMVL